MKTTTFAPGEPCWVELGTTDVAKSAEFYGGLFGWSAATDPRPEAGGYTMCSLRGAAVAAMTPLFTPGQPVAWSVFFATPEADQAAAAATAAGAAELMAPTDVFDLGRFAVVQDPTGAVFCLWQAKAFQGFALYNEPGTACWTELATRDVPAAKRFYTEVFGWTVSSDDYPHLKVKDGGEFGGIQDMNANNIPHEVHPHWAVYFKTEDISASVGKATVLGAHTMMEPMHLPGIGQFAVLRDPQGAYFSVYQPETAPQ
jgi:predicted enzyme related to lactoylglutathione lyase